MSKVNPTKPAGTPADHLNYMAGPSWDISDPIARLRMVASSCFFGEPQYYVEASSEEKKGRRRPTMWNRPDGEYHLSPAIIRHLDDMLNRMDPQEWRGLGAKERMEAAIDAALAHDVEATLQVAVDLRLADHIRTTPQVILVRAANYEPAKGTGLIRKYAPSIIQRTDEPAVQLAYQLATYGKPLPNSLKKAWRSYLAGQSSYSLAKYRMESRAVKTVDVVNLTHPAGNYINQLVRGELETPSTWETKVSGAGSTPEVWAEAFDSMGHMALLRNLRNLINKSSVDQYDIATKLFAGAVTGQQLPFRYWSAYQAVKGDKIKPVLMESIEDSLRKSCEALAFPGRVMSLCDNSGSAWGALTSEWGTVHVAEIANLTAVLTAFASEHGEVGVFGDTLSTFTVSHRSSVFDAVEKANKLGHGVGGGTEHGIWLFWDKAIKENIHYDAVFVYSDMQAGHGGLYGNCGYDAYVWPGDPRYRRYIDVPKLINTYRSKVNPNVEVFLVQVAGYHDTIVPEHYNHTHILGGWSEGILQYAQRVLKPLPPQ